MARVAVKNHHHGTMNPLAQFQKEISVEKVLGSAMVCDPLQVFDCCPISDGAAAVVLASREIAEKKVAKPIKVLGVGQGNGRPYSRQKDFTVPATVVLIFPQATLGWCREHDGPPPWIVNEYTIRCLMEDVLKLRDWGVDVKLETVTRDPPP